MAHKPKSSLLLLTNTAGDSRGAEFGLLPARSSGEFRLVSEADLFAGAGLLPRAPCAVSLSFLPRIKFSLKNKKIYCSLITTPTNRLIGSRATLNPTWGSGAAGGAHTLKVHYPTVLFYFRYSKDSIHSFALC